VSALFEALNAQIASGKHRFHMPGHKGCLLPPLEQAAPYDLTELDATGSLWRGEGPVCEVENSFSKFYGSGATLLSAGGSTLCIQAMLALFCPQGTRVLMARNCHVAAVHTAALLSLEPVWLWPDEPSGVGLAGRITPHLLEKALDEEKATSAVVVTSPDYFGVMPDVKALSAVCRKKGVPLLVDNAHGAHLVFFEQMHPLALGADACCDSLHKTLPALTGTALLHLRDKSQKDRARRLMAVFGSTSPSYLMMLSADMLADGWGELSKKIEKLACDVVALQKKAQDKGIWAVAGAVDPLRISLLFAPGGRKEVDALLNELLIEAEMVTDRHIVLLPSPQSDLHPVEKLIERLQPCDEKPFIPKHTRPVQALPMAKALFGNSVCLSTASAVGKIAAFPVVCDPPGVALVVPGEIIPAALAQNSAGIRNCFVVE
jgi:arginine/lysine/ornithine decarboxylase